MTDGRSNTLTTEAASQIMACQGVYRASDAARAYGVHRSTVTRIWNGQRHQGVQASPEAPNVLSKNRPSELAGDIQVLINRGMSPEAVAEELGISTRSVYAFRGCFV